MKNIRKLTYKGAIKQYFLNFYSQKPPPALFPPLRTGSLVFQYRIESSIWACGLYIHSSEKNNSKTATLYPAVAGSSNCSLDIFNSFWW